MCSILSKWLPHPRWTGLISIPARVPSGLPISAGRDALSSFSRLHGSVGHRCPNRKAFYIVCDYTGSVVYVGSTCRGVALRVVLDHDDHVGEGVKRAHEGVASRW
jgi:hypothetical protein